MDTTTQLQSCRSCGQAGTGKYCSNCGQTFSTKRISIKSLLHDVFHFFTHLEKGFGYTLKQLIIAPGAMQREYVEGKRARYQKPFSMFLLCGTIQAVGRYFVDELLIKYYSADNGIEALFYHEYTVLLYSLLMPFFVLISWLFFWKAKYNYAETFVLQLYNFSFIFLMVTVIAFLKLIWPHMDTAYIELPVLSIYGALTVVNFYNTSTRWLTVIKGLAVIAIVFFVAQKTEVYVLQLIQESHK